MMRIRGRHSAGNYRSGFTLIELLIVVAIIGILASLGVVNFISMNERAINTTMKSDLSNAMVAIEDFRIQSGQLPADLASFESLTDLQLSSDVVWDRFTPEPQNGIPSIHMHLAHPKSPTIWHAHYPAEGNTVAAR